MDKMSERLKELSQADTDEEALQRVEKALAIAAAQEAALRTLGVVSFVVTDNGLLHFTASPHLLETVEGLTVLEQGLSDLQRLIIRGRKGLMHQAVKSTDR